MSVHRKPRGSIPTLALIATSLLAPGALAQRVSFGVVAGGYANRDFVSHYIPLSDLPPPYSEFPPDIAESDAGGYVVGVSLGVRLLPQLSVGVDALYKPLHYRQGATFDRNNAVIGWAPATVLTWQFPVLAKYNLRAGRVMPFVEAGPSFRATGNLNRSDPSHVGATAGVGVETPWWRVGIAPRVRYTRWAKDPFSADVRTRADQVEFPIGFTFRRRDK